MIFLDLPNPWIMGSIGEIVHERIYNFAPGPSALPLSVVEKIRNDLPVMAGVGMSALEISHRSRAFGEILDQAEADIRMIATVPDTHHVLFLQGGASLQ